ncbi:MAG: hypothetical protein US40_C0007G0005 [Candidatus Roizmanbacteria bacterium GW2011_GWC2_37_13]|uniref:Uncharacterized protein n=1 Tax=Candidatus Roizmanbacteria bacterium GW2011_GWC2_37_13 TaxID=1618486 RepID=A0A0G0JBC4_9BACT|nr:MAG: hypothetical protein US38_C0012G0008 [Candidatus Roizmanbacteria bacterium GW2011_GWC1_37_12]KKQ25506.1 MAG: hypothetical protein US40_C0007G0005 [Candidatus Roizmanbacteria bacterium GW2011_GWC2_37_13]
MKLQAADVNDAFGTVDPPKGMNFGGSDPVAGFGTLIGFGIRMFIIIAGIFLLVYLFWGAFDWITSSGEKEKVSKAQNKITNALIGIILIFAVIVVFQVLAGNILKIIVPTDQGWQLNLPTL